MFRSVKHKYEIRKPIDAVSPIEAIPTATEVKRVKFSAFTTTVSFEKNDSLMQMNCSYPAVSMVIFSVKSKPKKIRRTNVYKKSKKQYKKAIEYSSSTSEEGAKLN